MKPIALRIPGLFRLSVALITALAALLARAPVSPVTGASGASVGLSADYVSIGGTVTVAVTDPNKSTLLVYSNEATSRTGAGYAVPAGAAGDLFVFQTRNAPIADKNGDGFVGAADLDLDIDGVVITSISPLDGFFFLMLGAAAGSARPFTVTYATEQVESVTAKVTGPSDSTGFTLTLTETSAGSGVFQATFKTGGATVTTNAGNPAAAVRPVLKAVDGNTVSVLYTDTDPLAAIINTVMVDGVAPAVTQLAPAHLKYEAAFTSVMSAVVTDSGSGVDVSSIVFHYDADGDATFDEPGVTMSPDPALTSSVSGGVLVRAAIPYTAAGGLRSWYVSAADIAGTIGRSDADSAAAGNQAHVFTADVLAPGVTAAVHGDWYDAGALKVKTGAATRLRVTFSEAIAPLSVVAGGFRVNGAPAASAATFAAFPADVWLTLSAPPREGPLLLTIDEGSVTDLAGIPPWPAPVTIADSVPPALTVRLSRSATNGVIVIFVGSDALLAAAPRVTVNGVTQPPLSLDSDRWWSLEFDAGTLTGVHAGDGPKTVSATGFDLAGNIGTAPALQFQLDRSMALPAVTPGVGASVADSFPVIQAVFSGEAGEYTGDTHAGVSIVLAELDGVDVSGLMTSADSVTWTLRAADAAPGGLAYGSHTFTIQAVDAAGNLQPLLPTVFTVTVFPPAPPPAPAPTPTPEPPTPAPEETSPPASDDDSEAGDGAAGDASGAEETSPPASDDDSEAGGDAVGDASGTEEPADAAEGEGEGEAGDAAGSADTGSGDGEASGSTPADSAETPPAEAPDGAESAADDAVTSEAPNSAADDAAAPDGESAAPDAEPASEPGDEEAGEADAVAVGLAPAPEEEEPAPAEASPPSEEPVAEDVAGPAKEAAASAASAEESGERGDLDEPADEETAAEPSEDEEGGGRRIAGCNLPFGGGGPAGAEHALFGIGLLGLGLRSRLTRSRVRKRARAPA